jgi:hypothetical protein
VDAVASRRAPTGAYGGMVDQLWRYVQWMSETEWHLNMRPKSQRQAMAKLSLNTIPSLHCSIGVALAMMVRHTVFEYFQW